jgi:GTP-binding protein
MPVIAIVGRPNVGKSALLNGLVGKLISIVQDMPGVTRDRISAVLPVESKNQTRYVELVDTGGIGFVDPDRLTDHINHQIDLAIARADLVLFVVDVRAGLTHADEEIARLLRRKNLKTVLLANKADGTRSETNLPDFARLGLGTPVGISALQGRNFDAIYDAIRENLDLSDAPTEVPDPELMVAIVGKRNAGKSTLVNSIAELYGAPGERVIVSEVPGTTRDSIDVRFEKDGKALVVIDTAGVRKKRHMVTNDIEFYSFHRAQRSIRRASVVLMLIDGIELISEPDKKLADYIVEQFKPAIIVINKWDLVRAKAREMFNIADDETVDDMELMERFEEYVHKELPHLRYAPIAFITAKDSRNIQQVVDLSQKLFKQATHRVSTSKLNEAVKQVLTEQTPSTPSGRRAKVYYVTQVSVMPPTIVLFVNNANYVNDIYQRFMVNRLRDLLPYSEVPMRLMVRSRADRDGGDSSMEDDVPRIPSRGRGKKQMLPTKAQKFKAEHGSNQTQAPVVPSAKPKSKSHSKKRPPEPKPKPKPRTRPVAGSKPQFKPKRGG